LGNARLNNDAEGDGARDEQNELEVKSSSFFETLLHHTQRSTWKDGVSQEFKK
jgi:hypothetical protein